jgi:hypothetical protein
MEMIVQPSSEGFGGKTYSLRPDGFASDSYFKTIGNVADALLQGGTALPDLIDTVRWVGASKRNIRRLLKSHQPASDARLLHTLRSNLSSYTTSASGHLKHLKAFDRLDRTLTTTEEQHHLFMLEIELGNRFYTERFRNADLKIAMLPHCLRDLDAECRAAERDIDYVCKGCTDSCNVNRASKVLRLHKVKPYIWMEADLKSLFRNLRKGGETVGVLGIACVPELAKGMRMCHKYGVPAVGVPLDANRCSRWWGAFYPNTVNLEKLESVFR